MVNGKFKLWICDSLKKCSTINCDGYPAGGYSTVDPRVVLKVPHGSLE